RLEEVVGRDRVELAHDERLRGGVGAERRRGVDGDAHLERVAVRILQRSRGSRRLRSGALRARDDQESTGSDGESMHRELMRLWSVLGSDSLKNGTSSYRLSRNLTPLTADSLEKSNAGQAGARRRWIDSAPMK